MQKVLIVEDERLIRADIVYKATRSGLNFEWIMEAESGEEALEILERNRPDILVTDVMMDGLSGIELIRRGRELLPGLVSIIICGYPDFHFAQEAISLDVLSYLLKPVRLEQVREALQKAVLQVMRQQDASLLAVRSDVLRRKLEDGELRAELYAFLNGFQNTDTVALDTLFPEDARFYQTALLHFDARPDSDWDLGAGSPGKKGFDLLRYAARNIALEMGGGYFLPFDNLACERQVVMIMASPALAAECAGKQLLEQLQRLHGELSRHLKAAVSVGLSPLYQSMSVKRLDEARQALDLRLCLSAPPGGGLFSYRDYAGCAAPEPDFELYKKFLGDGDITHTLGLIRQTFASFREKPVLNLRLHFVELVCILVRYCSKQGTNVFSILGSEYINGAVLDGFSSLEELARSLCGVITAALDQWVGGMENTADILRRVKNYVGENFADPELCMNGLASRFSISPGYLSASFKKIYGTTLSKFIIETRMEHARELLQNMKLPIRVVAESCGFHNLSYFMRVFKKYYGYTCSQCRAAPGETPQAAGE